MASTRFDFTVYQQTINDDGTVVNDAVNRFYSIMDETVREALKLSRDQKCNPDESQMITLLKTFVAEGATPQAINGAAWALAAARREGGRWIRLTVSY